MKSCTSSTPEFISFFEGVEKIYRDYMERSFSALSKEEFSFKEGASYIKISKGGSVHCFVDKKTGDVLKAASWKAPAKGARGNIFDGQNGLGRMTPYGTEYNK